MAVSAPYPGAAPCPQPRTKAKIPRPPNAFLIYRCALAKECQGIVATELSRAIGKLWREETPERKAYFAALATEARIAHGIKHPNYKFSPVKRGTGKRAMQLAAAAANPAASAANINTTTTTTTTATITLACTTTTVTAKNAVAARKHKASGLYVEQALRRAHSTVVSTITPTSASKAMVSNPSQASGAAKRPTRRKVKMEERDGSNDDIDGHRGINGHKGRGKDGGRLECPPSLLFRPNLQPSMAIAVADIKCSIKREQRSPSCFSSSSSLSSCESDMTLSSLSSSDDDEAEDANDDDKDEDYFPGSRQRSRHRVTHNRSRKLNAAVSSSTSASGRHLAMPQLPMTPTSPDPEYEASSGTPEPISLDTVVHFTAPSPHPYSHQHHHQALLAETTMETLARHAGDFTEVSGPSSTTTGNTTPLSSGSVSCASLLSPTTTVLSSMDDLSDCGSAFSLEDSHHHHHHHYAATLGGYVDDGSAHHHSVGGGVVVAAGSFHCQSALEAFEPECLASHHKMHWEGLQYASVATTATAAANAAAAMVPISMAHLQPAMSFTYSSVLEPTPGTAAGADSVATMGQSTEQDLSVMELQMGSIDVLTDAGLLAPDMFRSLAMQ